MVSVATKLARCATTEEMKRNGRDPCNRLIRAMALAEGIALVTMTKNSSLQSDHDDLVSAGRESSATPAVSPETALRMLLPANSRPRPNLNAPLLVQIELIYRHAPRRDNATLRPPLASPVWPQVVWRNESHVGNATERNFVASDSHLKQRTEM